MRILIVKLSAIGDIVHTLPALNAIRTALPDASITWVAEARSAEILRGNEMIDNLLEIDTSSLRGGMVVEEMVLEIGRYARMIREREYDVAIDFQGLLKSGAVTRISGAKKRWGFSRKQLREPTSRVFLTDAVKIPPKTHVVRKNLMLANAALGIGEQPETIQFPIFPDRSHRDEADAIISGAGGRFAILNPAGGWVTKLWHAEKFGELADRISERFGLVSLVATGPNEVELAQRVLANSRSGKAIAIQPSLRGFYEVAKKAAVYIGGDTGPTHLAIAAGTPIVGIFGPTEWWRNGSLNENDICVERYDIGCRINCHRRTCGNWICMDISVDRVFQAVSERLTNSETDRDRQ